MEKYKILYSLTRVHIIMENAGLNVMKGGSPSTLLEKNTDNLIEAKEQLESSGINTIEIETYLLNQQQLN